MMGYLPLIFPSGFLEARIEEVGAFHFIAAVGLFFVVLNRNPHSLKDRAVVPVSEDQKIPQAAKGQTKLDTEPNPAEFILSHDLRIFILALPFLSRFPAECEDCAPALQGHRATEQCAIYALLSQGHCSIRICDLKNQFCFVLGFFCGEKRVRNQRNQLLMIDKHNCFGGLLFTLQHDQNHRMCLLQDAVSQLREKAVYQ